MYYPKPEPSSHMTIGIIPPGPFQRFAIRMVERYFSKIKTGHLNMIYPDSSIRHFGDLESKDSADIKIHSYGFFTRLLIDGDIGFGEAYMNHDWDSSDPVRLVSFFINHCGADEITNVIIRNTGLIINRIRHRRKRNTINGSKQNIHHHYDLGNDFFKTFLDKIMLYSCAIFKKKTDTLETAQMNKVLSIIRKADIHSDDHVLEIGSGWGGFAIQAVKKTGCKITTVTISRDQFDYVSLLIKKEKLEDRITVLLSDYRHIQGSFDKIVSIEMLEAVGHENFGSYFSTLERVLKPGGRAVLQVITIPDHRYNIYRRRIDWIQKYIFPGGHLPSITALCTAMTKNSTLFIEDLESFGDHYATTLREWRKRFSRAGKKLIDMGYDDVFQRMWNYYLISCEAGFTSRIINDIQITLVHQKNTGMIR